jgi:hypothetical protein
MPEKLTAELIEELRTWFSEWNGVSLPPGCDCASNDELCAVRSWPLEEVEPPPAVTSLGEAVHLWILALKTGAWRYEEKSSWSDPDRVPKMVRLSGLVV